MGRKQYLSFAAIAAVIVFISIVFRNPAEVEETIKAEDYSEEYEELEKSYNRLYRKNVNMEGKIERLKEENEMLNEQLDTMFYDFRRTMAEMGILHEFFAEVFGDSLEIINQSIYEDTYTMIFKGEDELFLYFDRPDNGFPSYLPLNDLDQVDAFSRTSLSTPEHYFFGGFITDDSIKTVRVLEN